MNLTERIGDFIDERANAEAGWNGQVIAFRDFVEMELAAQRKACAYTLRDDLVGVFVQVNPVLINTLIENCLNAVEKSDDK